MGKKQRDIRFHYLLSIIFNRLQMYGVQSFNCSQAPVNKNKRYSMGQFNTQRPILAFSRTAMHSLSIYGPSPLEKCPCGSAALSSTVTSCNMLQYQTYTTIHHTTLSQRPSLDLRHKLRCLLKILFVPACVPFTSPEVRQGRASIACHSTKVTH